MFLGFQKLMNQPLKRLKLFEPVELSFSFLVMGH